MTLGPLLAQNEPVRLTSQVVRLEYAYPENECSASRTFLNLIRIHFQDRRNLGVPLGRGGEPVHFALKEVLGSF